MSISRGETPHWFGPALFRAVPEIPPPPAAAVTPQAPVAPGENGARKPGRVPGRPNVGHLLLKNGIISQAQLDEAIATQAERGCRLGEALVGLDFCSDAQIAQVLAEQLEIPYIDLHQHPPSPECVALISRETALEHGVLPVRLDGDRLLVAVRDPYDIRVDEVLRRATDHQIVLGAAPESQIRDLLYQFYSVNTFEEARTTIADADLDLEDPSQSTVDRLLVAGEDMSATRVVSTLIADAVRRNASDLHIEPDETHVRVRYRIDGKMCSVLTLPTSLLSSVAARIKIVCSMDISESRKPQDGGCRVRVHGQNIEIRASTLPGVYGEIVVLRLQTQQAHLFSLDALGMDERTLRDFRRLLSVRQGMILITGPTGSGKTTTLYGALSHLNRDDVNILTVEDPVERKLPGLNQVQVNDRAGRSFAATLRSMLRQDPDIIMLGEIRDLETADIACRAALTGHLVLSTLHTTHAVGTLARLHDMGVPSYMLAAALNGVVAQRLARRVCEKCAVEFRPPSRMRRALEAQFGSLEGAQFRKGRGCPSCHHRGTRGRVGIYEYVLVDEDLRTLLAEGVAPSELRKRLRDRGFRSMEEDAFEKACRGIIPPEDVVNLGLALVPAADEPVSPGAVATTDLRQRSYRVSGDPGLAVSGMEPSSLVDGGRFAPMEA